MTGLKFDKKFKALKEAKDKLLKGKDPAKLSADDYKKLQSIQSDMIKCIKEYIK